jgi:SAM-dependent methyltransferase
VRVFGTAAVKETWPAPERNKQPILELLQRVLPASGTLLEIASGTGQHAAFFAAAMPLLDYQPSDVDEANLRSIRAWVDDAALPNLRAPLALDVCSDDWGVGPLDAIFNANMIHIAPIACCEGLMHGAGRHLREGGVLVVYGPFKVGGAHTSESNARFDADLQSRDSRWGVREVEQLQALGAPVGLRLEERVPMPANNQCLVFRKR